jgi:1-acyl-sn-glycerol-3-phosphate acyltransferase
MTAIKENSLSTTHSIAQFIAQAILRLLGWKVEARLPQSRKFVLVGAPHTSNWDFIMMLLVMNALGLQLNWVGKDSLFNGSFGSLMRRLGGIPVDRSARNGFVEQMVAEFERRESIVLVIAPEGTRGKSEYWKTGFYYIAQGARVPIALGYVDYAQKTGGIGASLQPSGDIQADMLPIARFYAGITGKHPQLQGEIRIRQN